MRRLILLVCTATLASPLPAAAQSRAKQLIDQARDHLEGVRVAPAYDALLSVFQLNPTPAERLRAFTLLGIAELLRQQRQAALGAFENALKIDGALRIDSLDYLADGVLTVFADARTRVLAAQTLVPPTPVPLRLAMTVPADTSLESATAQLPVVVRPTGRAMVFARVGRVNAPDSVLWIDSVLTGGGEAMRISWPLRRDGNLIADGSYVLRVHARDSAGQATQVEERRVQVARAVPDTQPLPPPLAPSAFAPENVPGTGGAKPRILLSGAAIALLIAATPMVLAEPQLNEGVSSDPTAPVVAGGVAIASVVAFVTGRRPKMIAENVAKNRALRESHQRQRETILRDNAVARERAPIRVTVERAP